MRRPLAWMAAVLLCSGCAVTTATPPQIEVADVQLRGIGLLTQTLGVTLCVTNPNASELAFRRIQVAVDAAGSPLAEGTSDAPVRLPPQSSTLVPFTVISTVRHLMPSSSPSCAPEQSNTRCMGSSRWMRWASPCRSAEMDGSGYWRRGKGCWRRGRSC